MQPEMSAQVWLLAVLSSVPAASGSMESGYGLRAAVVEALEAAARSGNSMGLPVGPVFCATLTAFIGGLGVAWLALWLGHLREGPTSAAAETEEAQVRFDMTTTRRYIRYVHTTLPATWYYT
jgi:hypothetical protein